MERGRGEGRFECIGVEVMDGNWEWVYRYIGISDVMVSINSLRPCLKDVDTICMQ